MSIKRNFLLAGLGAALLLCGGLKSESVAQETITWRVQTGWLPGNALFESVVELSERVETQSGGRLKIEMLPAGAVVALNQTLDSVRVGIVDGHVSYPSVYAGIDPGFSPLGDLPGAYDDRFQTVEFMYYGGGLDLVREAYATQGLFTVGVGTGSWEAVPSRVALNGWDDFKGLKLRTPPGMGSLIWERFGAVPIVMPQTEVFSALEKGVIDAADDGSLSYNFQVGDYDIVKHTLINSPHSNGIWDFSVNADRWAELPADIQSILETNMREVMVRNIMNAMRGDEAVMKKADEIGLSVFALSDEDRAEYRKVAVEIWDEWAGKSDLAKKVIETHKTFLKGKGLL
ncbi:TRAP transporter substrate-binding protein DctP [Hoeflea ulvae]|uniref:TRAP transporter substrate-binding protein DctP n=1 Tax=Hoeflea ulvae TaxID=2983764 RepID=A0ABT3YC22_9HYPH|nr:TRAP transporter substrate-binding protein DctP [Hoeflea ulvae]MCY0093443.1 TRAP transporter substrate-binding protein DctP [Hoeflea ulvae]